MDPTIVKFQIGIPSLHTGLIDLTCSVTVQVQQGPQVVQGIEPM